MTSITQNQPTRRGGRGARTRILNAAAELFYFEGINATGVKRIAGKASVSKRTLYQHFPSKAALVEEYLRRLDPDMLGNQIALLYEGASARSTSLNDPAPWARARATADALISMWLPLPAPRR
jgi:AcrR family transcriptional regulator